MPNPRDYPSGEQCLVTQVERIIKHTGTANTQAVVCGLLDFIHFTGSTFFAVSFTSANDISSIRGCLELWLTWLLG